MTQRHTPSCAFGLLGLPRRFRVDHKALDAAYFQALARTHPDRFTDPLEQADASEMAAQINEAYRTLRDPLLRAQVLLGDADHADKNAALPPDFLMQMMEVRETMEQAEMEGDTDKLRELAQWAGDRRLEHLERLASLLDDPPSAAADPSPVDAARQEMHMLRYIDRMLEQMPHDDA